MPPPDLALPSGGGSAPPQGPNPPITRSFVAVTAGPSAVNSSHLAHVMIAHRHITYINDVPAILFTPIEVEQLNKQRENTLIMKFSTGRPQVHGIRAYIAAEWNLPSLPAVGHIDPRHASIHIASFADTTKGLALNKYKMNNSLFRLFRWIGLLLTWNGKQLFRPSLFIIFPELSLMTLFYSLNFRVLLHRGLPDSYFRGCGLIIITSFL